MDVAEAAEGKLDINIGMKAIRREPIVQKKAEKAPAKVIRAQEDSDTSGKNLDYLNDARRRRRRK